jgi:hypothetical protein
LDLRLGANAQCATGGGAPATGDSAIESGSVPAYTSTPALIEVGGRRVEIEGVALGGYGSTC